MMRKLVLLSVALIFLSACAVDRQVRHSDVVIDDLAFEGKQAPAALNKSLEKDYVALLNREHSYVKPSSPVAQLLVSAQAQQQKGQLDAASNTIERALRISPRNPLLWHQLASLRYQQGDLQQALQLANKSNSFAGTDKQIQIKNWQIITQVKTSLGDRQGTSSAQAKVADLLK